MALESLQDLYLEQLRDLHSAERQIIEALPKMIEQTSHPELRQAFELHLRQTEEQLRRLEQIGQKRRAEAHRPQMQGHGRVARGRRGADEGAR